MHARSQKGVVYTMEDDREVTLDADHITVLEVANTHAA